MILKTNPNTTFYIAADRTTTLQKFSEELGENIIFQKGINIVHSGKWKNGLDSKGEKGKLIDQLSVIVDWFMIGSDLSDLFLMHSESSFSTTAFYRNPRVWIPMSHHFPSKIFNGLCSSIWEKFSRKEISRRIVTTHIFEDSILNHKKKCSSSSNDEKCDIISHQLLFPHNYVRVDWLKNDFSSLIV